MAFGQPKEYVLKTTVDRKAYEAFAEIAESNGRSLSNQLRIAVLDFNHTKSKRGYVEKGSK